MCSLRFNEDQIRYSLFLGEKEKKKEKKSYFLLKTIVSM